MMQKVLVDHSPVFQETAGDVSPTGQRQITEMEFAAYSKDEFSAQAERKIVQRMFEALDPLSKTISENHLGELLQRLGESLTDEQGAELRSKLFPSGNQKCPFDTFYDAFQSLSMTRIGKKAFAMVSGNFKDPYQQQQLYSETVGEKFTHEYRVWFFFKNLETGEVMKISPWHDIPLYVKDIVRTVPPSHEDNRYNFICEIPKWSRAKFEIATKEPFNPIKQDIKSGMPRFYKHGDMLFNYGCLPQTWESPEQQWPGTTAFGDNDPMDAIEIGVLQQETGSVTQVKVLGILGMIDNGEMDWKVICISVVDPMA
eukprot:PhF_6_TR15113/c0_g1_i4/m.23811/K01507/ppa; inorganic pyrophosphatase